MVLAVEVGGRFGAEMADFLRRLAASKARAAPPWLRAAARQAAAHCWTGMLAVAAQRALALSLLQLPLDRADECDGVEPPLADLLADARHVYPVVEGCMPLRACEREGARSLSVASSADQGQTAARKSPRGKKKRLCVLATEVGGRWSRDAHELVRQLVCVRALWAPPLQVRATAAWARR